MEVVIYGLIQECGQSYQILNLTDSVPDDMLEGRHTISEILQNVVEHEGPMITLSRHSTVLGEIACDFSLWLGSDIRVREFIPCVGLLQALGMATSSLSLYFYYDGERWLFSQFGCGPFLLEITGDSVYFQFAIMSSKISIEVPRLDLIDALQELMPK